MGARCFGGRFCFIARWQIVQNGIGVSGGTQPQIYINFCLYSPASRSFPRKLGRGDEEGSLSTRRQAWVLFWETGSFLDTNLKVCTEVSSPDSVYIIKLKKIWPQLPQRTTLEDGASVGALALNVPSGNHCQVLDHSGLTGGCANCPVSWMRKGRLR